MRLRFVFNFFLLIAGLLAMDSAVGQQLPTMPRVGTTAPAYGYRYDEFMLRFGDMLNHDVSGGTVGWFSTTPENIEVEAVSTTELITCGSEREARLGNAQHAVLNVDANGMRGDRRGNRYTVTYQTGTVETYLHTGTIGTYWLTPVAGTCRDK